MTALQTHFGDAAEYTGVRSEQFPDYGAVNASILTPDGRASAKGSP